MTPKTVKSKRREAHKITAQLRNLDFDELMLAVLDADALFIEELEENKTVTPITPPKRAENIKHPFAKLSRK